MPKLRSATESFVDAQRHIAIGRARLDKDEYNQNMSKKLDTIMTLLTEVITNAKEEMKSLLNRDLNNAINLYKKELKKDVVKIDYARAVPAIYSATDQQKALKIGLQFGIERDQVILMMKDAPLETNLGKALLALMPTKKVVPAVVIPTAPNELDNEPDENLDDNNTIDSDGEPDDELKALLGGELNNEEQDKPWEQLNISRATYYRDKHRNKQL